MRRASIDHVHTSQFDSALTVAQVASLAPGDWASQYIGAPFKEHGRDPTGWDCWGIPFYCLARHWGVKVPSYVEEYEDTDDAAALGPVISRHREGRPWRELGRYERACAGDVVLMRRGAWPVHVGLAIDRRRMLHVESNIETSIENFDGVLWRDRVVGIYRHIAMERVL